MASALAIYGVASHNGAAQFISSLNLSTRFDVNDALNIKAVLFMAVCSMVINLREANGRMALQLHGLVSEQVYVSSSRFIAMITVILVGKPNFGSQGICHSGLQKGHTANSSTHSVLRCNRDLISSLSLCNALHRSECW